jgi:lauroyl/myristoyl acyltransferase
LLGPFHVTGVFWYHFPRLLEIFPAWATRPLVVVFTSLFFVVLRTIRGAVAANLEPVLGPCGWLARQERIFRTLLEFAWCFGERYEMPVRQNRVRHTLEGAEYVDALARSDRGAIFVTAHIGHWEMASRQMAKRLVRHAHVVREEEVDPQAQEFVREMVRAQGGTGHTTHFANGDPRLGITLAGALRRGEYVALQGDRPRAGSRSILSTLFGRPMPLPAGPAVLARTTGVPLIPVFSFREGRFHYRVVVRAPIEVSATEDRTSAVQNATQRLAADIEWAIRERPHQWFCFRRLWPDA